MGGTGLLILLCTCGFLAMAQSQNLKLDLYLADLSPSKYPSITDQGSQEYIALETQVKGLLVEYFQATLLSLVVQAHETCTKLTIEMTVTDQAQTATAIQLLQDNQIELLGSFYILNANGCVVPPINALLEFNLYIKDFPWLDDYGVEGSDLHTQVKEVINVAFKDLDGYVNALVIIKKEKYIQLFIEYANGKFSTFNDVKKGVLANSYSFQGIDFQFMGKAPKITTEIPTELTCPPVDPNVMSICAITCSSDDECLPLQKCCKNSCGGTACIDVFAVKLPVTLDLKEKFDPNLLDVASDVYKDQSTLIKTALEKQFNGLGLTDLQIRFKFNRFGEKVMHSPGGELLETSTTATGELFLSKDIANEEIEKARKYVLFENFIQGADFGTQGTCGASLCEGVCKHLPTKEKICSCNLGRTGPSCTIHECRKVVSAVPDTSQHVCQNGGTCHKSTEPLGYICKCPAGYAGDSCEVRIVDYFGGVCDQGYMLGDFETGEICSCNSFYKGLFCDSVGTETLTACQKKHRWLQYVYDVITGKVQKPDMMYIDMEELLDKLKMTHFILPYCDQETGKDYSECKINSKTKENESCTCHEEPDQVYASMEFVSPYKCVSSASDKYVSRYVYMFINDYNEVIQSDELYTSKAMKLKNAILEQLNKYLEQGQDSYISSIRTNKQYNNECVRISLTFKTTDKSVNSWPYGQIKMQKIILDGEEKAVHPTKCPKKIDIFGCPENSDNFISPTSFPEFEESIPTDTTRARRQAATTPSILPGNSTGEYCTLDGDCEGFDLCCRFPNARMKVCTEVGFYEKVNARIVFNSIYMSALSDLDSLVASMFVPAIEKDISKRFEESEIKGYLSAKVLAFNPVRKEDYERRRRRQTENSGVLYTAVDLQIKFSTEIDIERLHKIKNDIIGVDVNFATLNVKVLDATFADNCDQQCHKDSICVTRRLNITKCACPEGKTGTTCSTPTCMNKDNIDMCQNHGVCTYSRDNVHRCQCHSGYFGRYCKEKLCKYMTDDACGEGNCIGDIENLRICDCPSDKTGVFCSRDKLPGERMTDCEKEAEFNNYIVSLKRGNTTIPNKFKVSIDEFIKLQYQDADYLKSTRCWPTGSGKDGFYHSYCLNNLNNGSVVSCTCTDQYGYKNNQEYDYATNTCKERIYNECQRFGCENSIGCNRTFQGGVVCMCQPDYTGTYCETDMRDYPHCPLGSPLNTTAGQIFCGRGPGRSNCPSGYSCNISPTDRWAVCCFDPNYMCEAKPDLCGDHGKCLGNFSNGKMCTCEEGYMGLFCTKQGAENLTPCQEKNRFHKELASMLAGKNLSILPVKDLRAILQSLGIKYIPIDMCDDDGEFESVVEAVSIFNEADKITLCLDEFGEVDTMCRAAKSDVCEKMSLIPELTCRNGGKCIGDVKLALCKCRKGFTGPLCQVKMGLNKTVTKCKKQKEMAEMAINFVNKDNVVGNFIRSHFDKMDMEMIFMPVCNNAGNFTYSGCSYLIKDTNEMKCHCATPDGTQLGDSVNVLEVPDDCMKYACSNGSCHRKEHECANGHKCQEGKERCVTKFAQECEGDKCHRKPIHHCQPKGTPTTCDPMPCQGNPLKMCPRCGYHGTCYNKDMHSRHDYLKHQDSKYDDNDSAEKQKEKDDDDVSEIQKEKEKDYSDSKEKEKIKPVEEPVDYIKNLQEEEDHSRWAAMDNEDDLEKRFTDSRDYMCGCRDGYRGDHCEINVEVCSLVEAKPGICSSGCIGDIESGRLCRCSKGWGGINCLKKALTECEERKALFDDALEIMEGTYKIQIPNDQMKELVKFLMMTSGLAMEIPKLTCTANGFYEKLQTIVDLKNMTEKKVCFNYKGEEISSNVEALVGYPPCTIPNSFDILQRSCDTELGSVCMNGGRCNIEIFKGKICHCPPGYNGLLCQHYGTAQDEPESFCELMSHLYDLYEDIAQTNKSYIPMAINDTIVTNSSTAFVEIFTKNLALAFIDARIHRRYIGEYAQYKDVVVGLKAECNADGTFKPSVCDYVVATGEIVACYCWGIGGPINSTRSDKPKTEMECQSPHFCEKDAMCPDLKCPFGYRMDHTMCPTCHCKAPCEGYMCMKGERCVTEKIPMCHSKNWMECVKPVCRQQRKMGMCPKQEEMQDQSFGSIIGGPFSSEAKEAEKENEDDEMYDKNMEEKMDNEVKCFDDADCQNNEKCCGYHGRSCTPPLKLGTCADSKEKARKHAQLLLEMKNASKTDHVKYQMLQIMTGGHVPEKMWFPTCENDNVFTAKQCKYTLDALPWDNLSQPTECFCVDRRGNFIKGTQGQECTEKPYSCPILEPEPTNHASMDDDMMDDTMLELADECSTDFDCLKNDKCCSTGMRNICAQPVDTNKLVSMVDKILDNICENDFAEKLCQGGGKCTKKWKDEGIICECPDNKYGTLCESDYPVLGPETPCLRKESAAQKYANQDSELFHLIKDIVMQKMEMNNTHSTMQMQWEMRKMMTMVAYTCNDEGQYEPTQSLRDFNTGQITHHFCVDEDGKEIPGTRMSDALGIPFCGDKDKTCPYGHAYRDTDSNLFECGKEKCPYGYQCKRSYHAKLVCCPSTDAYLSVCRLPLDKGKDCNSESASTRFYFDGENCAEFHYFGCEGNKNNFMDKEHCERRCVDKVNDGECPARTLPVSREGNCYDRCESDESCGHSEKCCETSCGRQCIPAIMPIDDNRKCPLGNSRGVCKTDDDCKNPNLMCKRSPGSSEGVCCVNIEDGNYCMVKPQNSRHCHGNETRYYFNPDTRKCETFKFGGCNPDLNNFRTLEDCCEACSTDVKCKAGHCPNIASLSVSCVDECSRDVDCSGKELCCMLGCRKECALPTKPSVSDCFEKQRLAKMAAELREDDDCFFQNMPMCNKNGTYKTQQCNRKLGRCWCVTPTGRYIKNTLTKGVARCHKLTDIEIEQAEIYEYSMDKEESEVCREGALHCCSEAICHQSCPAHPEAMCRIDPCGGCQAKFYTESNVEVDCFEGLSTCQIDMHKARQAVQEKWINAMMATKDYKMKAMRDTDMNMKTTEEDFGVYYPDLPPECQLPPQTGLCKGYSPMWYYDPLLKTCNMFVYGNCGGNSNRFKTPEECFEKCYHKKNKNPCTEKAKNECEKGHAYCGIDFDPACAEKEGTCKLEAKCVQLFESLYLMKGIYVPQCLFDGKYKFKQCNDELCWCVLEDGDLPLETKHSSDSQYLTCDGGNKLSEDYKSSDSTPINLECRNECQNHLCPDHPFAECVVEMKSNDCRVFFVDKFGEWVDCGVTNDTSDSYCEMFMFNKDENDSNCTTPVLECDNACGDVCSQVKCNQNPCALCQVDPCTCKHYFVHIQTNEIIPQKDCDMLNIGSCEVANCNEYMKNYWAMVQGFTPEEHSYKCDANGHFEKEQCVGTACYCVNQEGTKTEADIDGKCKEIDKVAKITIIQSYDKDFDEFFKEEGRIEKFKKAIRQLYENTFGLKPELVKVGEPYSGSIMAPVTIETESEKDDLSLVKALINKELSKPEAQHLEVDGERLKLKDFSVESVMASKLKGDDDDKDSRKKKDDDEGLDRTEIIIIAVVSSSVGLLIIGTIIYCCCCSRKTQKSEAVIDDHQYDHIRTAKSKAPENVYDNPTMYNKGYEEDGQYMKVRL